MKEYGIDNRISYEALMQDRHISLPCLAFCAICALIFGCLPILPASLTRWFRPLYIGICFAFLQKDRYRISGASISLIVLHTYLTFILVCYEITSGTFTGYFSMVLFAAFFVVSEMRLWTKREIVLILNVVIIACTVYAFLMLRENESLRNREGITHLFLLGNQINRNTVAFAIVPGSVCSMFCLVFGAWGKSRWKTVYFAFTAAFCLYVVFCTGGRSAFYSAAFGDFLIVWEVAGRTPAFSERLGRRILIIAVVTLSLVLAINLFEGEGARHIFNLTDSSGRDEIWEAAWQMIREKPVFGGGFSYWGSNPYGMEIGTHNNFLTIMLDSGWVGGIMLAAFLLAMLTELWSCRNYALMAFSVELLCHTWTEPGMDYFAYIPLCIAYMLYRYLKNANSDLRTLFEG